MYKNYKKRGIQKSDFQDLEKHKKIFGVVPDDRYFTSKNISEFDDKFNL
jgi:hypothetical protein